MKNKKYSKDGILYVLDYLKRNKPFCGDCDHCRYGWNSKFKKECLERQEEIKKELSVWNKKVKLWEERLNNE